MKLKKNFIYQFSYQILAILLPLITSPYISRVLHAEGVGDYAYTSTAVYYFYVVCMLGFDTYGQRKVAQALGDRGKRSKVFSEIATLQIIITLIASIIYFLYVFSVNDRLKLISAIQYFYLASALINYIWLYEGVEEFKSISLRSITVKIISFVLIFIFVKKESDLWKYTLIMTGSMFCGNILFVIYMKRYVDFHISGLKDAFMHLKPSLLLFIPQIGITIFMQMDKLMLGWWTTSRQVGYYQNSEKIINVPISLILTVGVVIMPRIIGLRAEGKADEIKRYNSLAFDLLMLIGVGCTFGIMGISPIFTPWFFGEDFRESSGIMAMLSAQIAFMTWENVIQKQYLVPFEKDAVVIKAMTFAALINVVLNAALIPKFGSIGAIIGSLLAHLFICIYEGSVVRHNLPVKRYLTETILLSFAGCIMTILIRELTNIMHIRSTFVLLLFEILIGGGVYILIATMILKLMHSEVITYVKDSVRKIRIRKSH